MTHFLKFLHIYKLPHAVHLLIRICAPLPSRVSPETRTSRVGCWKVQEKLGSVWNSQEPGWTRLESHR